MMKTKPITQLSGDLDAMLALLPATLPDRPLVRIVARTHFGTLELYTAKPDPRWAEGYVAIACFAQCHTLVGTVDNSWTLVRSGPDPDGVVSWSVCSRHENRIMQIINGSTFERWKSLSIHGEDISHFSDEHDEYTVYPEGFSERSEKAKPKRSSHPHLRAVQS